MLNSKAVTKIQAVILAAVIVVAAVAASVVYVYWPKEPQQMQTIKIGVIGDLDNPLGGDSTWKGAVLAAEQINAEGGILGRQIELISEDTDEMPGSFDPTTVSTAMTKLITYHKVDYIIGGEYQEGVLVIQDIIAEHKKIFISVSAFADVLTQRVRDNYDRYKYFFKVCPPNATALDQAWIDAIVTLREYTGFDKLAYLADDLMWTESYRAVIGNILPEVYGFDTVYRGVIPPGTMDFTSYFAAAEAAGAEILVPMIGSTEAGIAFIKEWYVRQSPMVIWGLAGGGSGLGEFWEYTEGKCEHLTSGMTAVMGGYPISDKTLPMREAYFERWGDIPMPWAAGAYDALRFILPDAIERAGTTDTDAVIEALEETDIVTAAAPRFVFTSSHDIMFGPGYDEQLFFQWQANGAHVPVYPRELMEEAGATYTYPDWPGPWD